MTEHILLRVNAKGPVVPMCQGKPNGANESGRSFGGWEVEIHVLPKIYSGALGQHVDEREYTT